MLLIECFSLFYNNSQLDGCHGRASFRDYSALTSIQGYKGQLWIHNMTDSQCQSPAMKCGDKLCTVNQRAEILLHVIVHPDMKIVALFTRHNSYGYFLMHFG